METSEYTPGGVANILNKKKTKKSNVEETKKIESMFAKSFPIKIAEPTLSPTNKGETAQRKRKGAQGQEDNSKRKKFKTTKESSKDDKSVKSPRPADPERDRRTVFIGNVSTDVSKKQLLKLFKDFGKVESSRFRSGASANPKLPKKAAIIRKELHPSKPCLNAYIVFTDATSVDKAISLNGHMLEGRHLRVDKVLANKSDLQHGLSVFVGNVPLDAEEEDLREHFQSCGDVANVRIVRDQSTGLGKGFAFILFSTKSAVALALKLHEKEFEGRKLRVMKSTDKPQKVSAPKKKPGKGKTDRSNSFKKRKSTETKKTPEEKAEKKKKIKEKREAHKDRKLQHKKKLKRRLVGKHKKKVANILTGKKKSKQK